MKYPLALSILAIGCWIGLGGTDCAAQTVPSGAQRSRPGGGTSSLGPSPGDSGPSLNAPGAQTGTFGGRPGTSTPRIIPNESAPRGFGRPAPAEIRPIQPLGAADVPIFGPLSLPSGRAETPGGLTLDDAIELLVRNNRDLRAQSLEIPQARADVLTASLRANPILYADSQLIPYGNFTPQRPGGQTQYDVNITWPLDVSGKRKSRTLVAHRALHVLEAQYQDAVRLQIGNLYMAYVDALAARETVRYAKTAVDGLAQVGEIARTRLKAKVTTPAEVNRLVIQHEAAQAELAQAVQAERDADRVLGVMLDMPPETAENLELGGTLAGPPASAPDVDSLVALSLQSRPDLNAFRLGVRRADSDVKLAMAERYSDFYLLAQPYTFQNNAPTGQKSAYSWAIGLTVPLPIFNRNQGNIARAKMNVTQTQIEVGALERRIVAEVRSAYGQYTLTRDSLARYEREMIPSATQVLDESMRLYKGGEADFGAFLNARRDYNEAVRLYLDISIRHRRSALNLNTVAGARIVQ
jgi:cobalt-zinc-cadmium efflux system outer membrane protein